MDFKDMTKEDMDILNSIVTDEIYECLLQAKKDKDRDAREEEELMNKVQDKLIQLDTPDLERALSKVIDLQERMAKGMVKINKVKADIENEWKVNQYMGFIYWAHKEENRGDKRSVKALAHPNNRKIVQMLDYNQHLWNHWNKLKGMCMEITKDAKAVWPQYFKLESGDDTPYDVLAHKRVSPDVDNRMLTTDQAFFESHMEEQEDLFTYTEG